MRSTLELLNFPYILSRRDRPKSTISSASELYKKIYWYEFYGFLIDSYTRYELVIGYEGTAGNYSAVDGGAMQPKFVKGSQWYIQWISKSKTEGQAFIVVRLKWKTHNWQPAIDDFREPW